LNAQLEHLPDVYRAEADWAPRFEGLQIAAIERTAPQIAELMAEIQEEFGPRYLDQYLANLERVDPEGQAARRKLVGMVMEDADAGGALTDDVRREVQQSVRGGQAARGNILGDASAFEESMM